MAAIAFVLAVVAFKPWVHGVDGAGYYSWLRSFVIEGDLDTYDEMKHFEGIQQPEIQNRPWKVKLPRLHEGKLANFYPVGSAVLWLPFFLAAHLIVIVANAAGSAVPADGYSAPYLFMSMLGSVIWAFAGLTILYGIAARRFGRFPAALATGTVWLSTPLVFYMYIHPAMSHANDMFVNSLFILVWLATRRNRSWRGWLALGLVVGLATMVRTQNGLLVVFPCIEQALLFFDYLKRRMQTTFAAIAGRAAAFAGGTLAAFLPQMLAWKEVFGSYVLANAQQTSAGLEFRPTDLHLLDVFISSDRGMFIWSPVTALGLLGVLLLLRTDRRLAALLLCNFALQVYVIGSWIGWSGNISFGPRLFLNSIPAFTIGLAVILSAVQTRIPRYILVGACSLFVIWNLGLLAQYVLKLIPRNGKVPIAGMISNQFFVVPGRILGLIMRSVFRQ